MPGHIPISDPIARFIAHYHLGDYSSVFGIPLALWGLWVTYNAAKKAKMEAINAKAAVSQLRETLGLVDTVAELTAATALLEEMKRLHREGSWRIVLDRYPALCAKLIAINMSHSHLSDQQRGVLQTAVVYLKEIENEVECAVAKNAVPRNASKYNLVIAEQIDKIIVVLTEVRQRIGE